MLIRFYSSGKDKKLDMFKIILKYNSFQEKNFYEIYISSTTQPDALYFSKSFSTFCLLTAKHRRCVGLEKPTYIIFKVSLVRF